MKKTMKGKALGTKLLSRPHNGSNKGLAFWAANMLGQLYRWRPGLKQGLKQTQDVPREPGRFDVKAAFDAVNKR